LESYIVLYAGGMSIVRYSSFASLLPVFNHLISGDLFNLHS